MEKFTPPNFVAGSLPDAGTDPLIAAWHAAAQACDTEQVHLIHSVADGRIWYLAAPSSDFRSNPDSGTALAAALPGNPGHRGDAAYTVRDGAIMSAIVRKGDMIESTSGDPSRVAHFISARELDEIPVNDLLPIAWVPRALQEQTQLRTLIAKTTHYGWYALLAAGVPALFLIIRIASISADTGMLKQQQADALHKFIPLAQSLSVQPLQEQTHELRKVMTLAINAHGLIKTYRLTNAGLSYAVDVPSWISQDQLEQLGRDYHTTLDANRKAIVITRGAP